MADVQTEIEKISSAVYGEEVRGAMVNSLTKINAKFSEKANITDVNAALSTKADKAELTAGLGKKMEFAYLPNTITIIRLCNG